MGPTGISGKLWLDSRNAIDGALTFRVSDNASSLYFHTDYLRHTFGKIEVQGGRLPLYWGFGGKFQFQQNDFLMGVRIPLGVSYIYGESLFDMFFELVPFLNIIPDPEFSFTGAVGFRLYL
ncbi:hypothetical protein ACFL5V_05815 [Fibrobacterota bacterium]